LGTGSISILAGQTTASIPITIVDDFLVEGPETIIATLSSAMSIVTITTANATMNILDNDSCTQPITLAVSDVQISTVDLSWDMPAAVIVEGYEWVIVEAGADPLTATPIAFDFTLATELTVNDAGTLIKNTAYDFYVTAICSSVASRRRY